MNDILQRPAKNTMALDFRANEGFAGVVTFQRRPPRNPSTGPQTGLARALSKLGYCSRSQAWDLIQAGHVRVNGVVRRDPEWRVALDKDRLEVDGQAVRAEAQTVVEQRIAHEVQMICEDWELWQQSLGRDSRSGKKPLSRPDTGQTDTP